jgi:hypothetical protein
MRPRVIRVLGLGHPDDHDRAVDKVNQQIDGKGVPAVSRQERAVHFLSARG